VNKGTLAFGLALILLGAAILVGNLTGINVWAICWPSALILIGLWLVLRPRMIESGVALQQRILGDITRRGEWQVRDEEIWLGVGDVELDMTQAQIQPGETKLRLYGFVNGVDILVPETVGTLVRSTAFLTDADVLGHQENRFLGTFEARSGDYDTAERKVWIEAAYFVVDLKVRRV
jgi:lia operon protein LiaF